METLSWKWNQFWGSARSGSILGLICGLIFGLIFWLSEGRSQELGVDLFFGLSGAMFGGLFGGLIGGYTNAVRVGKTSPNQGIRLSWKNSLNVFLRFFLIFGFVFSSQIPYVLRIQQPSALIDALLPLLILGFIGGLNRGCSAVIKHYALRLILWLKGYTPFHFIKFLDHCAQLILLKKVGGGYIFIHRMLLDYFAELTPESIRAGSTATDSK